jgi:DNA-binding transcriptional LysR family regulator
MNMDQVSLETFIQVAHESSFSKAAEKLHITQPAISKRIANLETELGTLLFDRIGKKVQVTHSGEILLYRAKELLEDMRDCRTAIQNINSSVEGTLKLGVSHHIGLHRLPPYLKRYSNQYPKVQLKMQFIDSEKAFALIENGELEIALTTLSSIPIDGIKQETVWKDPLTFVVCDNHELAQMNETKQLSLSVLSQFPAILPNRNTYTGQLIQKLFDDAGENIMHYIETNYLETIKMMVSIGLGWTVLPRTMLNKELRGLQLNQENFSRNLGYIIHKSRTPSNPTVAFLNHLKSQHQ